MFTQMRFNLRYIGAILFALVFLVGGFFIKNVANATDTPPTAAISGITVPVTGATPTATIADTTEYTATISWSPTSSPFIASTAYTATITITPISGYTLTGVGANFFTVAGATATNSANSGIVTALFPATATPTTWSVSSSVGNCTVASPNCSTIQTAIDAAVSGDTINIAAGTYTEQLTINKPITIKGAGDTTVIMSPDTITSTFTTKSHPMKPVITVDGTTANISYLKVDGAAKGNNTANTFFVGIGLLNSGGTLDHVTVTGIKETPSNLDNQGEAIFVTNADSSPRTISITNSNISDFQKNGLALSGGGLTVAVSHNTITGFGANDQVAQNGIQISGGATGRIENNIVSGNICNYVKRNPNDPSDLSCTNDWYNNYQAMAISLEGAIGPITVSGNTVSNNDVGIYSNLNSGSTTITDNILTNNLYFGILFEKGDATVTGGSITGGEIGIFNTSGHNTGTTTIHNVKISGNSGKNIKNDASSLILDATNNWWGSASPVWNNIISGNVSYLPWYINPGLTILSSAVSGSSITGTTSNIDLGSGTLPTGITTLTLSNTSSLNLSGGLTGGSVILTSGVPLAPIILKNLDLASVSASIPDGTLITGPTGWDGIIAPPTVGTSTGNAPAGFSVGGTVISIGSLAGTLTFDKPVTILLPGVTGTVGYKLSGTDNWVQITNVCSGDYTTPTLTSGNECSINNGTDTKIVTFHFTSFGELDAIRHSSSGSYIRAIPATPVAKGKVLGAEKFKFTILVKNGSKGNEVIELQKLLTSLGYNIGIADGKFGPKTKSAIVKFQIANKLKGDGVVGAKTRELLNK